MPLERIGMRGRRALPLLVTLAAMAPAPTRATAQANVPGTEPDAPITYYVAEGSPQSGFREGDRALAEWALHTWAALADPPVAVVPGDEGTARIRILWVGASAGVYGEMRRRLVDGQRAADVLVHPDTEGLGFDIAELARADPLFRDTVVYLTCVHELGHAFGLEHTSAFADIMYSFQYGGDVVAYFRRFRARLGSRDDIRLASPLSAADSAAFVFAREQGSGIWTR